MNYCMVCGRELYWCHDLDVYQYGTDNVVGVYNCSNKDCCAEYCISNVYDEVSDSYNKNIISYPPTK